MQIDTQPNTPKARHGVLSISKRAAIGLTEVEVNEQRMLMDDIETKVITKLKDEVKEEMDMASEYTR